MAPKRTVTAENLVRLGAERLAGILLDLAGERDRPGLAGLTPLATGGRSPPPALWTSTVPSVPSAPASSTESRHLISRPVRRDGAFR